jgi:hypothetical protein
MELERIDGNEMQKSFIASWQDIHEAREVEDTTMEDANYTFYVHVESRLGGVK